MRPIEGPKSIGVAHKPHTRRELYGPIALPAKSSKQTRQNTRSKGSISPLSRNVWPSGHVSPLAYLVPQTNLQWQQKVKPNGVSTNPDSSPTGSISSKTSDHSLETKNTRLGAKLSNKLAVAISKVVGEKIASLHNSGISKGKG